MPDDDPSSPATTPAWAGGLFVYVPRGVHVEAPVLVTALQEASGSSLNWRTLIVLEEGAEAEVWEQYLSAAEDADGLFNTVVELVVGQNARLRYVCGQGLSEKSWIFGTQRAGGRARRLARLGRARLRLGPRQGPDGDQARRPGRRARRSPAPTRATARQHLDFDTTQEHAAPNTTSDLAFRGPARRPRRPRSGAA